MPTARPAAKVNLTLSVGARGADGYHPLRSVFMRIGLSDELKVEQATREAGADSLIVTGLPGCPVDDNLVLRAFAALRAATGLALPPLAARLDKRIPLTAGLGGGSSDAAAALELGAECWGIGLAPAAGTRLAASLGSDVPFFSAGAPAALVEGRGEIVTPLPGVSGEAGVLLAVTATQLSTGAVYARHDDLAAATAEGGPITDSLAASLRSGLDAAALADRLSDLRDANDLWPAAAELQPGLVTRRASLEQETGQPWLLTGSGPTLFTLYPSPEEARAAGHRLERRASAARLGATLLASGSNPVSNERRT